MQQVDKHIEKGSRTTQPFVASTEGENTKGIASLLSKLPVGNVKKTASIASSVVTTPRTLTPPKSDNESTSDTDEEEEEDDDVVTNNRQESQRSTKKPESVVVPVQEETDTSSDDEGEDDENDMNDHRQLLDVLQSKNLSDDHLTDSSRNNYQSRIPLRTDNKTSTMKIHASPALSPIPKKTTSISSSASSRTTTSSPKQRVPVIKPKQDEESGDDSYTDEDEKSLQGLHQSTDTDKPKSVHNYDLSDGSRTESDQDSDPTEKDKSRVVNPQVEELRMNTYLPGTKFRVTHDLKGIESGDLTIHKGEILLLVEQRPDDWWLLENPKTQEQGIAPINHIQLESKTYNQRVRHRYKRVTSPSTLVDVFKKNDNIPTGFIPSDLASLAQQNEYKLFHTLMPKRTESNFAFTDLHWRNDTNQLYAQQVETQKILTMKKCCKIPKIKGEQIHVLNRCVRVCLYDGFEIISNIHTIRAVISRKSNENDLTEDWYFAPKSKKTFIDEQRELLLRSNEFDRSKQLHLLIELSQLCQSKLTAEKCEIGCGWKMISLNDDQPPLISNSNNYNELLHGGHINETNILLDSQYSNLSGRFIRHKQARIKFSLESRENRFDLSYDNLPIASMIVPLNLVRILVFYRNELAYQIYKRSYSNGLPTTPIDSIFLSTFHNIVEQPDLVYAVNQLYRKRKDLSVEQQRENFIKIYELCIYPLLFYRLLPPYNFHDFATINQRRKLIKEMINKQVQTKNMNQPDILAILLDPNLTDKWAPFTTDEICFSLQKTIS